VKYEGEFVGGKKHGRGKLNYEDSIVQYSGEWKNDEASGHGTLRCENGDIYEGEFLRN